MKSKWFLLVVFLLILYYFKNAFTIGFFKDDLYFLNLAHAKTLPDFFNFFNPFKSHGYRPIPIELFYFLINVLELNFFSIHLIIFSVYYVGVLFFYKNIEKLTNNIVFARIGTLFYALSFIHVFQLYAAWNFQEVCLFTFLSLSFYFLLSKQYRCSFIFYTCALLSKETAIFFPVFLWLVLLAKKKLQLKFDFNPKPSFITLITITAFIFALIIKYELSRFAQNPLYTIHLEPRLIVNNLMWLGLWSLGLPTYLPDYLPSIFSPPLPDFYKALATIESRLYFYTLLSFLFLFFLITVYLFWQRKYQKKIFWLFVFCLFFFTLFNLPTLPTIHKWMVRLTIPLIFVSLFEAKIITIFYQQNKVTKILALFIIVIYLFWNYYGTLVHESASTYKLESKIFFKSIAYFNKHRSQIEKKTVIFIKDEKKKINPWGGSKKLNDTYWGQNFIQYLFPEKKLTMVYDFETKTNPKNAFVVSSLDLLPY